MRKLIFLILFLWGCGPAWHLQQAERKGAKVKSDTSKIKVRFQHKGPEGSLDLKPLFRQPFVGRTILKDTTIYKDSIRWKIRDNVITADCPDVEEEKEVPCVTTTTISAGFTKWQFFGGMLAVGIIVALVALILRRR